MPDGPGVCGTWIAAFSRLSAWTFATMARKRLAPAHCPAQLAGLPLRRVDALRD